MASPTDVIFGMREIRGELAEDDPAIKESFTLEDEYFSAQQIEHVDRANKAIAGLLAWIERNKHKV